VTIQSTFEPERQAGGIRRALAAIGASPRAAALAYPSRLRYSASFTAQHIFVVCAALLMVAAIPIVTQPLPPLEDYVNHLARMHVIATLGQDHNPRDSTTSSGRSFPT